jgi:cytochrome c-type biogenesis protein CcmF
LPAPYKFATLWSGQEGSLLFWSLLLAAYGFVLRLRYKTDPRLFAYASVVIAAVQVFFLLLLNFAARSLPPGALPAGSQVPGRKASN